VAHLTLDAEHPWVLQEFVRGQEYCTHSTVLDGRVVAHVCSRSSAFQVDYASVDEPAIAAWVERFVGALRLTGQVSFDFIVDPGGRVVPIECNPRTHSAITAFHRSEGLADAYLGRRAPDAPPLVPAPHTPTTYWLGHELARLFDARERPGALRRLRSGVDAVLDPRDPWPFVALYHLHLPRLLLGLARSGRPWRRIDLNIGKAVEQGGE
jgi:hypothetical protein